jgi:3-deoxy-manno-octulosonate cytidylyltransferase (CMP-KDO synthetase)
MLYNSATSGITITNTKESIVRSVIIVPARYGSTRFPGKPLAMIAGQTMLQRVCAIAHEAAKESPSTDVIIATDHALISEEAERLGVRWVMTPTDCPTGTDRALAAIDQLPYRPDFIINLQGDAPLTPPDFIKALLDEVTRDDSVQLVTPVVQLDWAALDQLRSHKHTTPFSGTTVISDRQGNALWFSKNIIPAMRNESALRKSQPLSPVYRHIGLYGYRRDMLERYVTLEQTPYEILEGLEQLRVLENGYPIRTVVVDYRGRASMSGVDTPEDAARAEALIAKHGELL